MQSALFHQSKCRSSSRDLSFIVSFQTSTAHREPLDLGRCRGRWTWELGRSILPVASTSFDQLPVRVRADFLPQRSARFFTTLFSWGCALGSGKQLAPSTIDITSHTSSLGIVRHCGLLACIWLLLLLLQSARPFEVNIRIAILSLN